MLEENFPCLLNECGFHQVGRSFQVYREFSGVILSFFEEIILEANCVDKKENFPILYNCRS
jgi:hypothetical protein